MPVFNRLLTSRSHLPGSHHTFSRCAALTLLLAASEASFAGNVVGMPYSVRPDHPRILIDSARLNELKHNIPVAPASFPASKGTLSFDILPIDAPAAAAAEVVPLFDTYDSNRNHLFIRYTGPGKLQVAMQDAVGYVGVANVTVTPGVWNQLQLVWDTQAHKTTIAVNGGAPLALGWRQSNGNYASWTPNQQSFVFGARSGAPQASQVNVDQIRNVRLYDNAAATPALLLSLDSVDPIWTAAWARLKADADNFAALLNNCSDSADSKTCLSPVNEGLGNPATLTHPTIVANVAQTLAFAYLMSGDSKYRDAALNFASRIMQVAPGLGEEWFMRGRLVSMAITYDWLFDAAKLLPAKGATGNYQQALGNAILATIRAQDSNNKYLIGKMDCGDVATQAVYANPLRCAQEPVYQHWDGSYVPTIAPYYLGSHHRDDVFGIATALLAIRDEFPVDPLLNTSYQHYAQGFNPAMQWVAADGHHHMGWAYGSATNDLLRIYTWQKALVADGGSPPLAASWQDNQIYSFIYGLRGDHATELFSYPARGDNFGVNLQTAAPLALWSARFAHTPLAQGFYNKVIWPNKYHASGFPELLFWQPGQSATDYTTLPLSRHFRVAGAVLARDTWDFANATLLDFKSSSFVSENHQHLDQNSFSLFYKAPLLLSAGVYDSYGSTHWFNYYTRTIAHNAITVFDPSEKFLSGSGQTCGIVGNSSGECSNDGGQWYKGARYPTLEQAQTGANHLDGMVRYEYHPEWTYMVGNASKAYADSKLDQTNGFVRSIVFLPKSSAWPKPLTVIFDKVQTIPGKEALLKKFILHTANEPEPSGGTALGGGKFKVAGSTLTVRNGDGMLHVQTLLPENPQIVKVGGNTAGGDYRFVVEQRQADSTFKAVNFPPDATTLAQIDSTAPKDINWHSLGRDMGAWRVEISAPQSQGKENFLHVLSVADNGTTAAPPNASLLSSTDNSTVAALVGTDQVLAFNRGNSDATHLRWTMPIFGKANLIAGGLLPGGIYALSLQRQGSGAEVVLQQVAGAAASTVTASDQGVISTSLSMPDAAVNPPAGTTATPSASATTAPPSTTPASTVSTPTATPSGTSTTPSTGTSPTPTTTAATTAFRIAGTNSGGNRALQLNASIQLASSDAGKEVSLYIAAYVPELGMYMLTDHGWVPLNPTSIQRYARTSSANTTINVLNGSLDVSALAGTTFFAGYGSDDSDMLQNRKYAMFYAIP